MNDNYVIAIMAAIIFGNDDSNLPQKTRLEWALSMAETLLAEVIKGEPDGHE